jgi:hypothetical protein
MILNIYYNFKHVLSANYNHFNYFIALNMVQIDMVTSE